MSTAHPQSRLAEPTSATRVLGGPLSSDTPGQPRVWVIVLNWNGEEDTAACVDSLLAQRGVSIEILVVDNASPDGSGERLHARYPRLAYLQTGANLGYAGGNNRGYAWVRARGADWVLVLNNDTVADPDCVRHLLDVATTDSRIAALAPLIVRHDHPDRVWFAGGRHDRIRAVGVHRHWNAPVAQVLRDVGSGAAWQSCSFLTGCCLLLRCAAIGAAAPFREEYFSYVEDLELSMRLRRDGWHIGWAPAARLAHRVPAIGSAPTPMQVWLRDRNRRRLVREGYRRPWRALFALWFWPTRIMLLVRYAARRDWARASAILTGMTAT